MPRSRCLHEPKVKREVAELLFEIGCEEIPAGMIATAARDLK